MSGLTFSTSGAQQVHEALKRVAESLGARKQILVGVPKTAGAYEDGPNIATIAAVNNFGTADGHIPARPFLAPAIEKGSPEYVRAIEVMLPDVLEGKMQPEQLFASLGELAQGHVQAEIDSGEFAPNSESTIRRKDSDRPLIDTGALRQSIRYVIAEADEKIEEGL